MSTVRRVPWLVVGGGVSGLAAARALGSQAPGGLLVEASERFGGIVRSEDWRGGVLDLGPDGWVAAKPQIGALCNELGLGPEVIAPLPSATRLLAYTAAGLTPMPAGLKLTIPTSRAAARRIAAHDRHLARRVLLEPLVTRKSWDSELADESIGDFVRRRMGRRWAELVSLPILAGIHSGDPNELSVRAAFPLFVEAERRAGSLLSDAFARRRGGDVSTFLSLRSGMQRLIDVLAAHASRGAELRCGDAVTRLDATVGGDVILSLASGDRVQTARLLLATGPRVAAELLAGPAASLAELLAKIPHRSAHVVLLALPKDSVDHVLDASGFIQLDRQHGGVVAATFLSSKWEGRQPEGHVIVRAFLATGETFDADRSSDQALATRAFDELRPLLGITSDPTSYWVRRFVDATPQPIVGHRERMHHARELQRAHPWLTLVGAGYDGVGLGDAVRSAHDAAKS